MKKKRQAVILELIKNNDIETQEELARMLAQEGFATTQGTISRDIRELKEQGMDREEMLTYYREKVYNLVRINISQDWACFSGMDEVISIVEKHLEG